MSLRGWGCRAGSDIGARGAVSGCLAGAGRGFGVLGGLVARVDGDGTRPRSHKERVEVGVFMSFVDHGRSRTSPPMSTPVLVTFTRR